MSLSEFVLWIGLTALELSLLCPVVLHLFSFTRTADTPALKKGAEANKEKRKDFH